MSVRRVKNWGGMVRTLTMATWPSKQGGDTSAHHALCHLLDYVERLESALTTQEKEEK